MRAVLLILQYTLCEPRQATPTKKYDHFMIEDSKKRKLLEPVQLETVRRVEPANARRRNLKGDPTLSKTTDETWGSGASWGKSAGGDTMHGKAPSKVPREPLLSSAGRDENVNLAREESAEANLMVENQSEIRIDVKSLPIKKVEEEPTPRSVKFEPAPLLTYNYDDFDRGRSTSVASTCSARSRIDSLEYD